MFLVKRVLNTNFNFGSTKTRIYSSKNYDLYDLTYKNKTSSLFIFTKNLEKIKQVIKTLQKIKHSNILSIIKFKEKKNETSIITNKIIPFKMIFDRKYEEYNKYILYVLAEVLSFLHLKCKILHRNINLDSLFIDENGSMVLGGFEEFRNEEDFREDDVQFNELVKTMVNKKLPTTISKYLQENASSHESSFIKQIEKQSIKFKILKIEEKEQLLNLVSSYKKEFIEIYKEKIVDMFINDLLLEGHKEYKLKIVDLIFNFDLISFDKHIESLFSVLDSEIRLYLCKNIDKCLNKVSDWNKNLFDNLILGVKCADENLKIETIKVFEKIIEFLDEKNIKTLLKNMNLYSKTDSSRYLVCKFVINNFEKLKNCKEKVFTEIYKLVLNFINDQGVRKIALDMCSKYYNFFNLKKLHSELLPILCTLLSDEKNQDFIFLLIEQILSHLKENKALLKSRDWNLNDLKNIFITKKAVETPETIDFSVNKVVKENIITKKEESDGWASDW